MADNLPAEAEKTGVTTEVEFEKEVRQLQSLIKKETAAEKAFEGAKGKYRESIYGTMEAIYGFFAHHKDEVDLVDKWLTDRGMVARSKRGKATTPIMRICRMAFSYQDDEKKWTSDAGKVSKYAKVIQAAADRGIGVDKSRKFFSEGLVKQLEGLAGEKEPKTADVSDYEKAVKYLEDRVAKILPPDLTIKIDPQTAGISPGRHKAYVEINEDGELEFLGFSSADEDVVEKEILREFKALTKKTRVPKLASEYEALARMCRFFVALGSYGIKVYQEDGYLIGLNSVTEQFCGYAKIQCDIGLSRPIGIMSDNLKALRGVVQKLPDWKIEYTEKDDIGWRRILALCPTGNMEKWRKEHSDYEEIKGTEALKAGLAVMVALPSGDLDKWFSYDGIDDWDAGTLAGISEDKMKTIDKAMKVAGEYEVYRKDDDIRIVNENENELWVIEI